MLPPGDRAAAGGTFKIIADRGIGNALGR